MRRRSMTDLAAAQLAAERKAVAEASRTWLPSKLPDNTTATIRFLPDADDNNDLLSIEGCHLVLPFQGIIGDHSQQSDYYAVRVPCFDQYKVGSCPVLQDIKPYWKQDSTKDFARTYYKIKTWYYTGFVVQQPVPEITQLEDPRRVFPVSKQLQDRILSGLLNAEFEWSPADDQEGRDFRIIKSKRGEFANYDQSLFSGRTRPWSNEERAAVERFGLIELSTLIPPNPGEEVKQQVWSMYQDSIHLKPFDQAKYPDFKCWPSRKGPMAPPALVTAAPPPAADVQAQATATMTKLRPQANIV